MDTHPGYYQNLIEYCKNMPCPSAHQIDLDLKRTFPTDEKCMTDEFLLKMRNILLCYSIRNITVGYCQGMNFLVARLLLLMQNEEAVFSFLEGKIKLFDIYSITEKILNSHKIINCPTIDEIFELDNEIRVKTKEIIQKNIYKI